MFRLNYLIPLVRATLLALFMPGSICHADNHTYAVIAKSRSDINFQEVFKGCQQAAQRHNDNCELLGPEGPANARQQQQILRDALASGRYTAIGLSVTRADVLANTAASATIPLLTYDSPFPDGMSNLARGYVGPDNEDIGRALGRLVQERHPAGGTLCIMSVDGDINLDERVLGLRRQLSGNDKFHTNQRLRGENNWQESPRCPWSTNDDVQQTMGQLKTTLQDIHTQVFVSVGSWPLIDEQAYRTLVTPYRNQLQERSIFIAIGMTTPEQRQLVNDQLINALVRIDFNTMGRQLYELMSLAQEKSSHLHDLITPVNVITPL